MNMVIIINRADADAGVLLYYYCSITIDLIFGASAQKVIHYFDPRGFLPMCYICGVNTLTSYLLLGKRTEASAPHLG